MNLRTPEERRVHMIVGTKLLDMGRAIRTTLREIDDFAARLPERLREIEAERARDGERR